MVFYNILPFIQIGGRVLHKQTMLFTSRGRNYVKYISRITIINPEEWDFLLHTYSLLQ